jgi:adenylosuccinate synthase
MKNSRFKSLLKNSDVISVRCLQWGDTGKGKLVHMLSDWADIIVRPSGGNNAGHTVFLGDKAKVFHALPSAISQDKYGKINVLGSNMVLDPRALCEEIETLNSEGFSCDNMQISQKAKLILPTQILEDRLKEVNFKNSKKKI